MAKCEIGGGENLWSDTRALRKGLEPPATFPSLVSGRSAHREVSGLASLRPEEARAPFQITATSLRPHRDSG